MRIRFVSFIVFSKAIIQIYILQTIKLLYTVNFWLGTVEPIGVVRDIQLTQQDWPHLVTGICTCSVFWENEVLTGVLKRFLFRKETHQLIQQD